MITVAPLDALHQFSARQSSVPSAGTERLGSRNSELPVRGIGETLQPNAFTGTYLYNDSSVPVTCRIRFRYRIKDNEQYRIMAINRKGVPLMVYNNCGTL